MKIIQFVVYGFIAVASAVDQIVDLSYSQYEGTALPNGVSQWLGIRYAAPPLGNLRFAAPTTPVTTTTLQPAKKHGTLCLANQAGPGLQYGKQPMDEDCLFLDVYAPTNATTESNLPVMVFIQGGGFSSDSNGNFNGSMLVENSGMNMIVITLNYRVGLLGFAASEQIIEGGSLNNGLKDVIYVLQWVQDRVDQFGGDIHRVVLSGDSVGAIIIGYLMAAYNGTGLPGYFHAAAAESTSFAGDAQVVSLQSEFDELVNAVGCTNMTDSLSCMRALNASDLQTRSPVYGWSPCIDNDILVAPLYELYEQRRFRQVPVIYGSTTDEGTKNVDKTVTTATLNETIRNSLGNITDDQLKDLLAIYPESLNCETFSGALLNATYPGAGNEWERLAAMMGDITIRCIAAFQSDMHYEAGNELNWHYHYDVLDTTDEENGNRVYHTVELNAIWGPNNTDGAPPPGYYIPNSEGGVASIVEVMQNYWISFVRTLDPNELRLNGTAEWKPWTTHGKERLLFYNNGTMMETMNDAERNRCMVAFRYSQAKNAYAQPLVSLLPFANGTYADPNEWEDED